MVRYGGSDASAGTFATLNAAYVPQSQAGSSRTLLAPPTPRTPATPCHSGRVQTMAAATGRLVHDPASPARSSQPDSARCAPVHRSRTLAWCHPQPEHSAGSPIG